MVCRKILATVAIISLLMATSLLAQLNFTKVIVDSNFALNSQPFDVKAADLDGDNEIDIVVSSPDIVTEENSLFLWYRNDGTEAFTESIIDTIISGGGTFAVADLDQDLDTDLLMAGSGRISWYDNDGNANFLKSTIDQLTLPRLPFILDFDADGDNDIVFSGHSGIFWENNDGNSNFSRDTIEVVTVFDLGLFIADLDDDSDNDVVAEIHIDSPNANIVVWYQNDGDENFTRVTIDTTQSVRSIVVADLDEDADQDIMIIDLGSDGDFIQWYRNDGSENFTKVIIDANFNRFPRSLAVADIDGDGDLDVLATGGNGGTGEVVYYDNDGSENFSKRVIDSTSGNRQRLVVIDMDKDLDLDLLVANSFPAEVVYYRNDGMATSVSGDLPENVPQEYDLWQNHPNPFNPATTISYQLPVESNVELIIYNLVGQIVTTLVAEKQAPGSYQYRWDANNLASGTYLYRLRAGDFIETKKLLLLR